LPDPRQLTGDFSQARLADGRAVTIYDPATTTSAAGAFTRTPFAGNIIPGNRIDPVARNVMKYLPPPNVAGITALGTVNFTRTDGSRVDKTSYSFRGDHNFNDKNRFFARYSYDDTPFNRAPVYGEQYRNVAPTAGPQVFTRWNTVAEDTHVFTPTLLATLRYSATRLINNRRPYSDNFDITSLGLPAYMRQGMVDPLSFPAITITGYSLASSVANTIVGGIIGATDLISFGNTTQAIQGNITKILSKHTLKFGGEYRVIAFNNLQTGDQATNFGFAPSWTQGPNANTSSAVAGLGLASFLLGIPSGAVNPAPALALTNKYSGFFITDTWRATSRLTVNWGLRYEFETPLTDRFNQLTNFDYTAPSPLKATGYNLQGGLTFVNVGGLPRGNNNPDRNNWAPRLGLAYRMNSKTVIRTGAGLFYSTRAGIGGGAGPFGTSGFQTSTSILTSQDGVNPIVSWSNPYPNGFNKPSGSSLGLSTLLGQSIGFTDRGNVAPSSAQWNFTIQRELPGKFVMEVGYAGSRGYNLTDNRAWNQLSPEYLRLGNDLRTLVPNPFFGQISVGTLAQPTVARAQLLRPYPQFDAVTAMQTGWGASKYNALLTKVEKRYASGLSILFSHTYSKQMDYGAGAFAGEAIGASSIQDNYNLKAEWSPSTLDQTHRFIANAVYELPFYKNKGGFTGRAFGGWQLGGIWSAFSGGPLGISATTNNTFSQGGGQRPNWTGVSAKLDNPTPARWFDTSQFSNPAAYTFGNTSRTFGGLRSDGTAQIDMTLTKNTRILEKLNLQFRAEVFNLTNSARFSPPNQSFGNAQFGVVSAQNNLPRIVQFGLKLVY
jgi:hypothetical protein